MPKIKVELTFDSIEELQNFFASGPVPAPTLVPQPQSPSQESQAGEQSSLGTSSTMTVVSSAQATPSSSVSAAATTVLPTMAAPSAATAPEADPEAIAKALHVEANEMIKRLPAGAGAVKAREILTKYGYARFRDVGDPTKAAAMITEFKATAAAAPPLVLATAV